MSKHAISTFHPTLRTSDFRFSVFISQTCVVPTLSKQFQAISTFHPTLRTSDFRFSVFISQTCVVPTLSKQFQVNRKKRQMENRILIHNSKSPLSCANLFVTRVCRKNTKMCQNKCGV